MDDTAADGGPPDQAKPRARKLSLLDPRPKAPAHHFDAAPSICRICRSEGTAAEPLFYPCKCSGSIKYVHQDCLMEWLSHSQKKYCELCKTSFRFTKLYAPDMPKSLPVHVFIEHMARYLMLNLLVWLRALVTVSVWACWLPYFMRSVWSFMFWVSDEGLGSGSILTRANETDPGASWLTSPIAHGSTCPASPLLAATTCSAVQAAAVLERLGGEDLADYLVRIFLGSLGMPTKMDPSETRLHHDSVSAPSLHNASLDVAATSSLFGDVDFLRNLTRSPTLNRAVIKILEGQVITVLVIVCFILVILVRDYVVQQQPEINMRAAFEEPAHQLPAQPDDGAQAPAPEPLRDAPGPESDDETLDDGGQQVRAVGWEPPQADETGAADTSQTADPRTHNGWLHQDSTTGLPEMDSARDSNQSAIAADNGGDDRASVNDYLRIYRRAGGDPEKILQIVEQEGLEDKLGYWVDVTRRSITKREDVSKDRDLASSSNSDQTSYLNSAAEAGSTVQAWIPAADETDSATSSPTDTKSKGKERTWLPVSPGPISETSSQAGPSRPRAASDGPRHQASTNLLGSNNWSFAGLPPIGPANGVEPNPPADASPSAETSSSPRADPQVGFAAAEPVMREANAGQPPHSEDDADDVSFHRPLVIEQTPGEEAARDDVEPAGLVGRVADFMWGDLHHLPNAHVEGEDNLADDDADAEDDPWVDVPMAEGPDENADADVGDDEGAVAGAGLDPEAMDDLEDFEGVMELIGMRGPIAGLFQNAIFCAVLVSVTIFACIFVPYNIGRVTLWVVANPVQIVRELLEFSKVVQDAAVMLGGLSSWFVLNLLDMFTGLVGGAVGAKVVSARKASWGLWTGAGSRVMEYALMDFPMSASDMQNFSAISHEALIVVKGSVAAAFGTIDSSFAAIADARFYAANGELLATLATAATSTFASISAALRLALDPSSWVIELGGTEPRPPVDPSLAHWPGLDRFWAVLAGYLAIFAISAMYLKRGTPFARGNMMQAWEAGVIDTLHQASGIMKVILIISIEMLVFPLYCGLLLDAALLPLFENTTIKSRILFTYNFPLTSVFVHWFVGTGYMFHFALFVSMCRKIMRPGVLYFIRDPDDPEFHPIRDVLERSLTTQLRKILFSAFVYGALVIVCLGGVVWSLAYGMPGVLPIHYSSNEPVLEFPVDLLFYNFLMPQAVKVLRPGDGLYTMYTWWFRKCARGLRLTYFLFGERRIDEEGTLQLSPDSSDHHSRHRALLLELNEHNKVVPKTWRDTFEGGDAKPNPSLIKSGRFVRAPASDRVKIPKGQRVFLTVTELGRRKDGVADNDVYASSQYQMVYIPPHFRARIFLFILCIWLFAAVTGVGITIAPLALGRKMFKMLIPDDIRTNDVYAFSIGIYVLGTASYSVFCIQRITAGVRARVSRAWAEVTKGNAPRHAWSGIVRGVELLYTYAFLLVVFPLLFSTMMELYIAIPLHTYMDPPVKQAGNTGHHTIRIIQAWTLGLLYLNLGTRMIRSLFPESRAALAVRTVVRRGWLQPDTGVLTRAFVVPGLTIAVVAVFGPPLMASLLIKLDLLGASRGAGTLSAATVYRNSYPAAALAAVLMRYAIGMARVFKGWKAGIRDEAYLIGERLHNLGATAGGARRAKRAWGAGRPRV
ncbi:RING-variant domain-containing protein [Hirsutella rhossiliensis]|uniref:RING-type E3 ubiquitin transferase n=1 Tax=Hirsutella rhossiliensis TaxID=111463 RepID=A0A9P8N1W8_9HYPO|nr:RING-variant domain-containing protein [Hirsutella rhossiliensis]KAH0966133.1 RING-variant domain-containing protein [Hirsutella rhossiliensis]